MKIFLDVCRNFAVIGIKSRQKHRFNLRNMSMIFFLGQYMITTAVFFAIEAKYVEEYANSFYASVSGLAAITSVLSSILEIRKTFELISDMGNFIEISSCSTDQFVKWNLPQNSKLFFRLFHDSGSENPVAKEAYNNLNEWIEKWSEIFHFVFVKMSIPGNVMPCLTITLFAYLTTDQSKESAFRLMFPASWVLSKSSLTFPWTEPLIISVRNFFNSIRFPFNWRTPLGYLIAFSGQSLGLFYIVQFYCAILCYFYEFCLFSTAFAEDIRREFIALTEAKKKSKEFQEKMTEIIDLHSQAKELSWIFERKFRYLNNLINLFRFVDKFAEINRFHITIYSMWSILTICSTLLLVQNKLVKWLKLILLQNFVEFLFVLFFMLFSRKTLAIWLN